MQLERRNVFGDLWKGGRAVGSGLGFVLKSEGGLRTALRPAAVAFGVWAGLAAVGGITIAVVSNANPPTGNEFAAIGRLILDVAIFAVVALASGVLAFALAQPLSRSALDRLASRLSQSLGAPEAQHPSSHLRASLRTALGALGFAIPTIGLVELVTVVAPEAAPLTEPFALLFAGLALTWDLFDHPMSRRGMPWRERLRWMRQNTALVLGFAIAMQAMLFVPVLDLFALPIGVLGATRLLAMRSPDVAPSPTFPST